MTQVLHFNGVLHRIANLGYAFVRCFDREQLRRLHLGCCLAFIRRTGGVAAGPDWITRGARAAISIFASPPAARPAGTVHTKVRPWSGAHVVGAIGLTSISERCSGKVSVSVMACVVAPLPSFFVLSVQTTDSPI